MFEEIRKELLEPHCTNMESNSNDMNDFGHNNCNVNSIGSENSDGINSGNDCANSAGSGIGDGCGCSSEAGVGASM